MDDYDIWSWILKTPEERVSPVVKVVTPTYTPPPVSLSARGWTDAIMASMSAQTGAALPAAPAPSVTAPKTYGLPFPEPAQKQTVNPAQITIDKYGQVIVPISTIPGGPGNPIPDIAPPRLPFNPSNMGPIGDLRPTPGFVPEGQMFAGAPLGVLMSSEEFRQYFYRQYGRWPFAEEITSQKLLYPNIPGTGIAPTPGAIVPGAGGGAGGGGGGGGATPGQPVPELLGELAWWENADSIQPLLRGWASWLKESVEANRNIKAIANPFSFEPGAEAAAGVVERAEPPMPGFKTTSDMLGQLQKQLGLEFEEADTATTKWQKFINAIPKAGFESQQLLASLRYDANADSWYSVDIGQLVNPRHT